MCTRVSVCLSVRPHPNLRTGASRRTKDSSGLSGIFTSLVPRPFYMYVIACVSACASEEKKGLYPGPSHKAGESPVRTVCACALISRHSGNSVTRTDTSVSFDVTTVYYPVLVYDFSLASRGLCPPVSSLPVLRSSRRLYFSQTCGRLYFSQTCGGLYFSQTCGGKPSLGIVSMMEQREFDGAEGISTLHTVLISIALYASFSNAMI